MSYVPDEGDLVWVNFDPQVGREQGGHRPALVLSPAMYNRLSGLMIACPCTTKIKGYPYEVLLSGDPASVALTDHVKSLDWRGRGARLKGRVQPDEIEDVRAKLRTLVRA